MKKLKGIVNITVQQVCALAALTVKNLGLKAKIPSAEPIWNGFLRVTVKVLNSYSLIKYEPHLPRCGYLQQPCTYNVLGCEPLYTAKIQAR